MRGQSFIIFQLFAKYNLNGNRLSCFFGKANLISVFNLIEPIFAICKKALMQLHFMFQHHVGH